MNGALMTPVQNKRRASGLFLQHGATKRLQGASSHLHPPPPHLAYLSPPKDISEIYYYVPDWRPPQDSWHCGCLSVALKDATSLQPHHPDSYSFEKFCQEILHNVVGEEYRCRVVHAQILLSGNSKEYWCFADEGGFNTFLVWLSVLTRQGALSQAGVTVVFCEIDGPWEGHLGTARKLFSPDPRCFGFE